MDIGEECGWDSLEGIDVQGKFSKPFKSLNLPAAFLFAFKCSKLVFVQ